MKKSVVIIDYQLGNLFSVKQACDTVGINARISSSKQDVVMADALILPGVGAFNEAMKNLKNLDLILPIKEKVRAGTPIFGICLGQQLLFTESEEFGVGGGLDLIPGLIKKFPNESNERKIKVPQISWNTIYQSALSWSDSPLKEIKNHEFMYFVHSYYVKPETNAFILANTNYEEVEYCSSVMKDNIFATQFHPEKSATKGLSIYNNWAWLNNLK